MTMKTTRLLLILLAIVMTVLPAPLPAQTDASMLGDWGYGFQLGMGAQWPTGSLADDFKGYFLFTGGLTGQYRDLRLKADVSYGQPSLKNPNPYNVTDDAGHALQVNGTSSATHIGLGIQLGYTVLRSGRLSITPAVGGYMSHLSWEVNDITWEVNEQGEEHFNISKVNDVSHSHFSWMASVDFDIAVHDSLTGGGRYTSSVRVTPFIAHAAYGKLSPAVSGNYIGLTVSYAGLMRMLNY